MTGSTPFLIFPERNSGRGTATPKAAWRRGRARSLYRQHLRVRRSLSPNLRFREDEA